MSETEFFATLPAARRCWVVASIHGEIDRLKSVHERLAERIAVGEGLVYLGNFMGHGKAVAETIEELLLYRRSLLARPGSDCDHIVYLRGSQEEMWQKLLQIQFAPNPREVMTWMLERGVGATLEAYGGLVDEGLAAVDKGAVAMTAWTVRLRDTMREADGHNALMSALHRAAYTEDKTLLFVNAGIDAGRPLSQQSDQFWWNPGGFADVNGTYDGFGRIVRGFDPRHPGIEKGPSTVTVDGGCGFGGTLLAACFDDKGEIADVIEA